MRSNAEDFADELPYSNAEPGGRVRAVPWAYDSYDGDVYLDTKDVASLAFEPDELREIADQAERMNGENDSAETEEETDDETEQWDSENDIMLQDRTYTVGMAETVDAIKPLSGDAQSVLVTPKLLRRMLDVADSLATKNAVWLTVEYDKPVLATPKGTDHDLSTIVTPRYNLEEDEKQPTEDL